MAFPRPQQKWVRKPSPLLSGESPGPRGPAKGQEDRTLHLFGVILSPNPPFRPFLLIFLLFPPGLTGDTCASECCFWRSHYCWSYLQLGTWAEKWVDAIVRLCLELGSPHWRPPPVVTLLSMAHQDPRDLAAKLCQTLTLTTGKAGSGPSLQGGHCPGQGWYPQ